LNSGDHLEKETISDRLRWGLIGILFVIFIFVIIKNFRESIEIISAASAVFLVSVFAVLNGRRFIKYGKWYLSPSFPDIFLYSFFSGDKKNIAWMCILMGIIGAILSLFILIGIFVGAISV